MLVILFKAVSYRGEFDSDSVKSMLNIGLDLATAGIFILLTNISFSVASNINEHHDVYRYIFLHGIKILLYLVILLVFSLGIKFFAWDKETRLAKNSWVAIILKNIIGILLLVLSIVFVGGNI